MGPVGQFFSLHRKFLIYNLVFRNLKVRYRRSIFGFLWTLIVPASMTLVYVFVFRYIAKIGGPEYPIFILSGVIPWSFFASAVATGTESLTNNFPILSKVPINCSAFPLAETCSSFINLILSLPVLILAGLYFDVTPSLSWFALPLILALLFFQTYAFSLILSMAHVYLRDVRHLVGIAIQIWMYLTPILYSVSLIPESKRSWFMLNPLFGIFVSIHEAFLEAKWPSSEYLLQATIWTFVLLTSAFVLNYRLRFRLVERL